MYFAKSIFVTITINIFIATKIDVFFKIYITTPQLLRVSLFLLSIFENEKLEVVPDTENGFNK